MTEKRKDFVFPNGSSLGISKLEYFAGLALQGLLANPEYYRDNMYKTPRRIVEDAIYFAKELVVEIKKEEK